MMEIKGATFLYTLATLMITFAGFSALLFVIRQAAGRAACGERPRTESAGGPAGAAGREAGKVAKPPRIFIKNDIPVFSE